jgi:hypothetical protein
VNAPIQPPDKFAEAKRFLLALRPDAPWTLTALHPTARGSETLYCESMKQVMLFLAENNGTRNIYFTAQAVQPVSSKPRLSDATL